MDSKTIKIVALIAFGVSMFVLGRVTDCGSSCFSDNKCEKQLDVFCGEAALLDLDVEALVGEGFEGDTVIIMTNDGGAITKEIRIEKSSGEGLDHGHSH